MSLPEGAWEFCRETGGQNFLQIKASNFIGESFTFNLLNVLSFFVSLTLALYHNATSFSSC